MNTRGDQLSSVPHKQTPKRSSETHCPLKSFQKTPHPQTIFVNLSRRNNPDVDNMRSTNKSNRRNQFQFKMQMKGASFGPHRIDHFLSSVWISASGSAISPLLRATPSLKNSPKYLSKPKLSSPVGKMFSRGSRKP